MIRGHASAEFHPSFDYAVMYGGEMVSFLQLGKNFSVR